MIAAGDRAGGASHARRAAKGLVETFRAEGIDRGGAAVLIYTLFGFLALPAILKSILSKPSPKRSTERPTLREIRVNPLDLSRLRPGTRDLGSGDAPGTWIRGGRSSANFQLASVIQGAPSSARFG